LRGGDSALVVELDSPAGAMANHLRAAGFMVNVDGHRVSIEGDTDAIADAVRDAAVALQVGLRRVERRRVTLEDVYLGSDGSGS
jgi:hypothetical protein